MRDRLAAFLQAFALLPTGTFKCVSAGTAYVASKSEIVGGRGFKLVGEALDGSDYISCNVYHLKAETRLFPCEMSEDKVIDFVLGIDPAAVVLDQR